VIFYDYILNQAKALFNNSGYEFIRVPIIEDQKYFSSEIVGRNPWPGWHPKSLFNIDIMDYHDGYDSNSRDYNQCFLIPEVTTSICKQIYIALKENRHNFKKGVPYKFYYAQSCFRNELQGELSDTKLREFTQIGLEYMGLETLNVEKELFFVIYTYLTKLGFSSKSIVIRLGDIRIFNYLSKRYGWNIDEENRVKIMLDKISGARLSKEDDSLKELKSRFMVLLDEVGVTDKNEKKFWRECIIEFCSLAEMGEFGIVPKGLLEDVRELLRFGKSIGLEIVLDWSVVRSQDYYNSIVFQVDLKDNGCVLSELGGGGRYDFFINRLLDKDDDESVLPASGFALSLERIQFAMQALDLEPSSEVLISYINQPDKIIFSTDIKEALDEAHSYWLKNKRAEVCVKPKVKSFLRDKYNLSEKIFLEV
jgi:histidyl-tRNA synthetase